MMNQAKHFLLTALLAVFTFGSGACATQPERQGGELKKAETEDEEPEVEAPSPEELAKSPCGNPDWAQLPEGAEDKLSEDGEDDVEGGDAIEDDENEEEGSRTEAREDGEFAERDGPCR